MHAPPLASLVRKRAQPSRVRKPARERVSLELGPQPTRIIQVQQQRLLERGTRSEARRVLGIAFDLGRSAFVALDQQTDAIAVDRGSCRVVQWAAGHDLAGLHAIGNNLLCRSPRTTGKCTAGEGEPGRAVLQEVAT